MQFFEETTLSPEREKEIRGRQASYDACCEIGELLVEIELLRCQKAKLLEDVRLALRLK